MLLNKIYNEDCLITMDDMASDFLDLTVTSPPYDKLRTYKGFSFDFEKVAEQLYRITKPGGVVVWVVGDSTVNGSETGTSFKQALKFIQSGFNLHDTMIYAKMNFIPQNNNRYEQEFEYMFVFSKGKVKTFNPIKVKSRTAGFKQSLARKGYGFKEGSFRRREAEMVTNDYKVPGNIFYYPCGNSGNNHPAVFPEQLAKDQIFSWSNIGDLVYDPFIGSGTTAKAAHELQRNWIGSEISAVYSEMANKRLDPHLKQTQLL